MGFVSNFCTLTVDLSFAHNWDRLLPLLHRVNDERIGHMKRKLRSTEKASRGTEYGGTGGYVQPDPHVPSGTERLAGLYQTDPADVDSAPEFPLMP